MKHPHIACIGDLTIDRYVERGEIKLGGAALNTAVWVKRSGAQASVVTAVGDDDGSLAFLKKFKQEGIDASHISSLPGSTSSIEIFVDAKGERRYGTWDPGTLASYHLKKKDIQFLKTCDAVMVTIYPQFLHVLEDLKHIKGKRQKKPLVVINYGDLHEFGDSIRVVEDHLFLSDILVFGLDKDKNEAHINELRDIARIRHKMIIITLGAFGSLVYVEDQVFLQSAQIVPVVDTTGAGDSFLAAFLVSYLQDKDIQQALAKGTELASRVIQKVGAY